MIERATDDHTRAVLASVDVDSYDPLEQEEIIVTFAEMLRAPTADGGRKREAGTKVPWTVDSEHREKMYKHLRRWESGETVDAESGAHPLVHTAWRALAIAWRETR